MAATKEKLAGFQSTTTVAVATPNTTRPCNRRHSASSSIRLTKQKICLRIRTSSPRPDQATKRRSPPALMPASFSTRNRDTPNLLTHNHKDHALAALLSPPMSSLQPRKRQSHRHRPRQLQRTRRRPASQLGTRSRTGIRRSHRSCYLAAYSMPIRWASGSMTGPSSIMVPQHRCPRLLAISGCS